MSERLQSGPGVCLAGLTGWAGQAVARAVHATSDMTLVCGVSRQGAGQDAGLLLDAQMWGVPVHKSVEEALEGADVLVDYTSHTVIRRHVMAALDCGVAVVVGTSGLTGHDYQEISEIARAKGVGVIAAGNYSLTAALMSGLALSQPVICPIGKSLTTLLTPRLTRPAAPLVSWRNGSRRLA